MKRNYVWRYTKEKENNKTKKKKQVEYYCYRIFFTGGPEDDVAVDLVQTVMFLTKPGE